MQPVVNTAIKAARQAGTLILRALDHLDEISVTEKSKHNYVTEIDKGSEKIIIDVLRNAYPDHGILAEEGGFHPGDEYQWVIDPLDGTTNFIHGYPHFCISLALKHKDKLMHGVIYDPVKNDIYSASRGEGAQLNDRRIRISKRTEIENAIIGATLPSSVMHYRDDFLNAIKSLMENSCSTRIAGSAALDLAYVAAGQLDAYWAINLKPWDIAAGILLIKEAGGIVMDYNGSEDVLETGNVVAGNIKMTKAVLKNLVPHLPKDLIK
jgi:myo-inositol-1(or 4)-monophosphatase